MDWKDLRKRNVDGKGLVLAIAQDSDTMAVLMVAYQNKEAFEKSVDEKQLYLYSTSKNKLWKKGEVSGNTLAVEDVRVDCDGDAIIYLVKPKGGACHEGYDTCFYRKLSGEIVGKKMFDPKEVYG
jgi:phosphoribosyl-AMP cyclohydrolase